MFRDESLRALAKWFFEDSSARWDQSFKRSRMSGAQGGSGGGPMAALSCSATTSRSAARTASPRPMRSAENRYGVASTTTSSGSAALTAETAAAATASPSPCTSCSGSRRISVFVEEISASTRRCASQGYSFTPGGYIERALGEWHETPKLSRLAQATLRSGTHAQDDKRSQRRPRLITSLLDQGGPPRRKLITDTSRPAPPRSAR